VTTSPVIDLIADNLGALPHPDGKPTASVLGKIEALRPEYAEGSRIAGRRLAESVVHLIEVNGWTIVATEEYRRLAAKEAPPAKVAVLRCNQCDTELLHVSLHNPDRVATNGAVFLNGLAKLDVACPHGPKP
jgi:hypothetical protein